MSDLFFFSDFDFCNINTIILGPKKIALVWSCQLYIKKKRGKDRYCFLRVNGQGRKKEEKKEIEKIETKINQKNFACVFSPLLIFIFSIIIDIVVDALFKLRF